MAYVKGAQLVDQDVKGGIKEIKQLGKKLDKEMREIKKMEKLCDDIEQMTTKLDDVKNNLILAEKKDKEQQDSK